MNQLRTSELFRYRQTYQQHKQKIKHIMNRSSESITQLSQKQQLLLTKNNKSHQKALKFRLTQKQRQINIVNSKFVDRIYSNDKKRTQQFKEQISTSRTEIMKARISLARSSAQLINSRVTVIKKDNSIISKKLNEVKSTISLKDFSREYDKHNERSSMLSKFKIDARSFKFIPKNQILLQKINKSSSLNTSMSKSIIGEGIKKNGFVTERLPRSNSLMKVKTTQHLVKLALPKTYTKPNPVDTSVNKISFKNVKLQQLNFSNRKYQPKHTILMKMSNPQSSVRRIKFNNF